MQDELKHEHEYSWIYHHNGGAPGFENYRRECVIGLQLKNGGLGCGAVTEVRYDVEMVRQEHRTGVLKESNERDHKE